MTKPVLSWTCSCGGTLFAANRRTQAELDDLKAKHADWHARRRSNPMVSV